MIKLDETGLFETLLFQEGDVPEVIGENVLGVRLFGRDGNSITRRMTTSEALEFSAALQRAAEIAMRKNPVIDTEGHFDATVGGEGVGT